MALTPFVRSLQYTLLHNHAEAAAASAVSRQIWFRTSHQQQSVPVAVDAMSMFAPNVPEPCWTETLLSAGINFNASFFREWFSFCISCCD
jgi:hypothetical protein